MYLIPGTTAGSAWKPELIPAFSVVGAVDTGYLRTAAGDAYASGSWSERDPVQLPVSASASIRPVTEEFLVGLAEALAPIDVDSALLSWNQVEPGRWIPGTENSGFRRFSGHFCSLGNSSPFH